LLARVGEEGVDALLALRRAELAVAGEPSAALDALAERLARVRAQGALALQRGDLALGGADVMAVLGIPPGPRVGEALRHLAEAVLEDPACNTREALTERLRAWWAAQPPDDARGPQRSGGC